VECASADGFNQFKEMVHSWHHRSLIYGSVLEMGGLIDEGLSHLLHVGATRHLIVFLRSTGLLPTSKSLLQFSLLKQENSNLNNRSWSKQL